MDGSRCNPRTIRRFGQALFLHSHRSTLAHQSAPTIQQIGGHAITARDFRYAFTSLPGLLDHPQLLRRRPAPTAATSGDDFDPLILFRHSLYLRIASSLQATPGVRLKRGPVHGDTTIFRSASPAVREQDIPTCNHLWYVSIGIVFGTLMVVGGW